ncbi:hypothetical protein [Magnetospirillum aberrantis]|uniref:Uncharacterized protein n=1 Tax=Magnetospirillum aberrantis SpK TaxID=908842 RepID=A0A7C9UWQ3_9PROT|nr:hypothetical protein [Magnetospirillum aberrantis]NFV80869.1 hypothetical protein [Magnetospirillum aberrantis SpK]
MSPPPNVSFEIQVLTDKHWVVADFANDEAKARAFADNLLQKGNHAAVRVVRDRRGLDGLHTETVIQEKTAAPRTGGPDLSLAPVKDAPLCRSLGDFYGIEARLTLGRMLRKYLDEVVVSPSELLHSAAEMKRFGDRGTLLFAAIDRISTLQAATSGEDGKTRRDFLSRMWDEGLARARKVAASKPKTPKTLAEVLKGVEKGGDEHPYLCLSLMTLRLLETRSWIGKLDTILGWAAEATEMGPQAGSALALMDGIVADILNSAQLIQDLLGYQANLGAALCSLSDLAEGTGQAAKFAPETFNGLNALFATGVLVEGRRVLLDRVARELGGQNPLSRNEPKQETEVCHKVMHRLVGHRGVLGEGASAEAMVHRIAHIHAHLGTLGTVQAVELTLSALSDGVRRVQFLLALAKAPMGLAMGRGLVDLLSGRVLGAKTMNEWVPARLGPPERMAALAAANRSLLASAELDEDTRRQLASHVDETLAAYLVDEGVIEKIDKPDDPLALRAIRLIKFCGSGVLIEGKSLNLARARVIEHLRQPQFEEKFLASVPKPSEAEKHLREFHRLLVETGFR